MAESSRGSARGIPPELRQEFEQIAAATGCELWHAEVKGGVLRLYIDKLEGVTLADCELVSKLVSAYLDVVDFGKSRYVLEVSSPGLDRQLFRPRDVERFLGRLARVTIEDRGTRKRRTVVARLQELRRAEPEEESEVVLLDAKGGTETVRWQDIQTARLEIEL
jgi:ribosome maturation factor RimP